MISLHLAMHSESEAEGFDSWNEEKVCNDAAAACDDPFPLSDMRNVSDFDESKASYID